jgi:hypothetical protein
VVNIGSAAPVNNGTVTSVAGKLIVNSQSSDDTVNVDDTGDTLPNSGTLTSTRLTGLGMGGDDASKGIEYHDLELLNINLGIGADTFTILTTHAGTTVLSANNGLDRIAVQSVSGPTTINGGDGSDVINVGSLATPDTNNGGNVNAISALLILNGGANTTGDGDMVNVDETGETVGNPGSHLHRIWDLGMPAALTR